MEFRDWVNVAVHFYVSCYCVLQNMLGQEKFLFDREAKSLHLEDLTLEKGPKLHSL